MTKDVEPTYANLPLFAQPRTNGLSPLLEPYVEITDRYGD